jgi:hypothetical protein
MFVFVCFSCVGRGLCDWLITRPKESYQVSLELRNLWCEATKVFTRTVDPLMMIIMIMIMIMLVKECKLCE